jgi:hypothetical protein
VADVIGVLVQIARGQAIEEIGREFAAVMDDVRECGGVGELTIKLRVQAKGWDQGSGRLREVDITHSVGSKRPKRKLGSSTFFVTSDGDLTRNNPAQLELDEMAADEKETRRGNR